jgi:thioredoxin reductase
MPAPIKPRLNLNSSLLFDAIIIGGGPAGLSAALALSRQKHPAVVFSDSVFRNAKAHRAHTVLGHDHKPAKEIRRVGREQIEAYGTTHFVERAVRKARKIEEEGTFEVEDAEGETWRGKKVVLAMGAKDIFPDIDGYAECWGESIYSCLFCDGIERSDKPAAMLGFDSSMNLHVLGFMFALECPSVTILSNGPLDPKDDATAQALEVAKAKGTKIDQRRIKKLVHLDNDQGIEVQFHEGDSMMIGFLQHTPPTEVVAPDLARDLGVEVLDDGREGTYLKRNEPFGETNVKGVFTAGDAGVVMKQFTVAMTQGVAAGAGVSFSLGQDEDAKIMEQLKCTNGLKI